MECISNAIILKTDYSEIQPEKLKSTDLIHDPIILTVLMVIFAAILINGLLENIPYIHNFSFGVGFYQLIVGVILMVVSFPILYIARKRQDVARKRGDSAVENDVKNWKLVNKK